MIIRNDGGDTPERPKILGAVDGTPPVFVETTGLYEGVLKGTQLWVTGTRVQPGIGGGSLVPIGGPIDTDALAPPAKNTRIVPEGRPVTATVHEDASPAVEFHVGGTAYDPSTHSVPAVIAYIEDHPDEVEAILAAERSGKARRGILREFE